MEKLDPKTDGATADIVEQNIERLKELFPEVFTEGSIDFDALRETLGDYVDDRHERYSFAWSGKARARRIAQTPSTGTLRPCPEESVNWDTTQNLFIEGDSLEVLKLLQKSYHKKVKMIYIDPPYNTGKDFIYPDDFRDNIKNYLELTGQTDEEGRGLSANAETGGRYHTNWLNMMYPRLKLAKNLLSDDGVIFISIDDNEVTNLHKVCEEVFGEENYLNTFCWVNNLKGRQISGSGAAKTYEFVISYAKSVGHVDLFEEQVERLKTLMPSCYMGFDYDVETDEKGSYVVKNELYNTNSAFNEETRPNLVFNIHYNPMSKDVRFSNIDEDVDIQGFIKIFPNRNNNGVHRFHAWRWSKDKIVQDKDDLKFVVDGDKAKIYTKIRDYNQTTMKDLISDISTTRGTSDVKDLFNGKKYFDFPKPLDLIKLFVRQARSDSVILDFLAGSCTTAHAVLDCNNEDSGKRRFIMVQLPEPCDEKSEAFKAGFETVADIGKERICRVIQHLESELAAKAKETHEKLPGTAKRMPELDLGCKVFKLDASNVKPWDADFDTLEDELFDAVENIKPDRTEADVLYELLLKYGLDLAVPIEDRPIDGKTVYIIGAGALVVCLADEISLEVVEGIAALKDELNPEIMRVVFKDAGFADDVVKTNTVQILRQAGIEDVKSL